MPNYLSNKMSYSRFVRSTTSTPFQSYDNPDVCIGWIDLLGTRGLNHQQIITKVDIVLSCAQEGSSTGPIDQHGVMVGTPNKAIQFALVGDALVIVQLDMDETPAAAILAFLYRINIISMLLNVRNQFHRGVITRGPVKCFRFEDSSIITGEGVVKAAMLEHQLKSAGLFYDESIQQFISGRQTQVDRQSFCSPFSILRNWNFLTNAPGLAGVCFSQFQGWETWAHCISSNMNTNPNMVNASNLISELKTIYKLP